LAHTKILSAIGAGGQGEVYKARNTRLNRTVAIKVCQLDQIQFLLGHVSIQTTERYLGCKQKLRIAVNDNLGIEPTETL